MYIFEWDEGKNRINQRKHGISFEKAKKVFSDPKRYEEFDFIHSSTEERWLTIGLSVWNILTVVFTERKGVIRIISARESSIKEQEVYFYGNGL